SMENVTAGQTVVVLKVLWCDDLMTHDLLRQIGRILRERFDDRVAERSPLVVPRAVLELVRRILHINRHHVLAFLRERRVAQRRNCYFEVRRALEIAVLRFIERTLKIINLVADLNSAL